MTDLPFSYRIGKNTKERLRFMKDLPCADCCIKYHPDIMHFHHRTPSNKLFTISQGVYTKPWHEIYDEILKCDVLCANCHGLRHVKEREEKHAKT